MPLKVLEVEPESIAEDLGLQPGDEVLRINGQPLRDVIDYQFQVSQEELEVEVRRDGEVSIYEVQKHPDEGLGLVFPEMRKRACGCQCVFCFVDQNPEGLRPTLYFKDEDFRISHIYGNYVTLTTVGPKDLERIVTQRLSPQYVSVHATDWQTRKLLFGLRKPDHLMEKIAYLTQRGITLHTQIVLCPGINDGPVLEKTVTDLAQFFPGLQTIAIVPVGLTKHRQGLYPLQRVTPSKARQLIEITNGWGQSFRKKFGVGLVYLADEFFILAGEAIPPSEYYDDFGQLENGVGMVRTFLDEFEQAQRRFPKRLPTPLQISLVTGVAASGVLQEVVTRLNRIANLEVDLHIVANDFYGSSIWVSGLLTGGDIYQQLKDKTLGEVIHLPPNCLNDDGLFLDDWTLEDLASRLHREVRRFEGDFLNFFQPRRQTSPVAVQKVTIDGHSDERSEEESGKPAKMQTPHFVRDDKVGVFGQPLAASEEER